MATGVQFYRLTSSQFSGVEKNSDALYFLTDTGEIFKGSVRFSYPVKLLADSVFPAAGETGVLYCTPAGAMKVWDGSAYVTMSGGSSSAADNFLKAAVRHEVTAEEAAAGGIYAGCAEGDTGILFTMEDGTRLFVKLSDLVDVYTATSGKGVALGISGHAITAEARVSAAANNSVVLKDDGLYAEKYVLPVATDSSVGGVSVDITSTPLLTISGGVLGVNPVKIASILTDPNNHMSGVIGQVVEGGVTTPYLRVNHDASLDESLNSSGVLELTVRKATTSETGTVKPGTGLSVTSDGTLNAATASTATAGMVKVGTGLEIADGVLSVKQQEATIEWKTV